MPDVITAGETMVLGVPARPGRLRHSGSLELKIGGAESNVAIALSRLGVSAGWASYLSADEPGQLVLDRIRAEGVDTSQVRRLPDTRTGLYLREYIGNDTRVYYYREGSAASYMAPDAFDASYLDGARVLHLTGSTSALSDNCRAFTLWAAREARSRGVRVSFDVNYRSKLWAPKEARAFVEQMLPEVDLLFVSAEESLALWDAADDRHLSELAEKGPQELVLKKGEAGNVAWIEGKLFEQSSFAVVEIDPVGAGDAFAAGYLAGWLWKKDIQERLRLASAMGALSVTTLGDYEALPDREELESFVGGRENLGR